MTFPEKISEAMPTDNELVIGTVTGINPLTISARGGPIEGVGRVSTTGLAQGDPVALLREGATWLAFGKVVSTETTGLGLTTLRWVQSTAILNLTAVEQDVAGTTVSFATSAPAANVVAVFVGDFETIAAATATGVLSLRVDGVTMPTPMSIYKDATSGNRNTCAQVVMFTVSPGSHTAVLRGNRVGGADGQVRLNNAHTTLFMAVFE